MGRKVNPIGYRLAVQKDWRSKWYASEKEYTKFLHQDIKVRNWLKKTLDSALANAVSINDEMDEVNVDIESLIVKEAVVNDARTLRRFKPRARGSAGPIRKRQSHISIVITEDNPANKEEK